jgi:hypothetical protein
LLNRENFVATQDLINWMQSFQNSFSISLIEIELTPLSSMRSHTDVIEASEDGGNERRSSNEATNIRQEHAAVKPLANYS